LEDSHTGHNRQYGRLAEKAQFMRSFLPTAYAMVAVVLVSLFADRQHTTIEMQIERERVRDRVSTLRAQLEGSLNAPIQAARGLVATLSSEPDMSQDRFEWLASRVVDPTRGIRNVAAARDLVVTLVHPMAENASALGLDYNLNDAQRTAALQVRDTGEFLMAGPVDLVQGGQAFIGRFPVFSTQDGTHAFWGILSVVIDLPTLYSNAGLTTPGLGLDLALVGTDGRGAAGGRFLGPRDILEDNPISVDILFTNGSWVLHARPADGWGSTTLVWPFRLLLLIAALTVVATAAVANLMAVQRKTMIVTLQRRETQLEDARREVESLALHDHLTGLPNRRYLDRKLTHLVGGSFSGLIQVDLDGFKEVNDVHGHAIGDLLLTQVANRFRSVLGRDDFIARVGGDEFVVVCPGPAGAGPASHLTDRDRLEATAKRLIDCMQPPFTTAQRKRRIGLSAGIHLHDATDATSPNEWMAQADRAMYRAKQSGRNRYEFAPPLPDSDHPDHSADDLLEALAHGQIVPFYQPQFAADGTTVVGVEALARWIHLDGSITGPSAFMAIARDVKVEGDIDQTILEQATRDLAQWDSQGLTMPQISVNASFRRLNDPQLLRMVDKIGVDPKRVSLEILESVFLDDENDQLMQNLQALRDRGFRIEIDDFGTGFSSITSLLKLRPHRFKIDCSLVQAAATTPENRRLLATIAEMGHALRVDVCAEGIETPEQFQTARAVGCSTMQGCLLARPMTASDIAHFLRTKPQKSPAQRTG